MPKIPQHLRERAIGMLDGMTMNAVAMNIGCWMFCSCYSTLWATFSSTRVRIHQPFSRTFFVFVSKICKFECNTTSDWLNRTV